MPHNPEAFAEMVVLTVKSALAPVLERLAASEQRASDLQARVHELLSLRDRITVVETKASMAPAPPPEPKQFDAVPLLERIALTEAKVATFGDLRDRVAVVERKTAAPVPAAVLEPSHAEPFDPSPLLERIAVTEAKLDALGDVRERVAVMETKAAVLVPVATDGSLAATHEPFDASPLLERIAATESQIAAIGDIRERVAVIETKAAVVPAPVVMPAIPPPVDLNPLSDRVSELARDVVTVRERIAAVEVRAQIPGPPGKDGANGKDGRDGADGLGFEDLSVDFDGDRTIELKFQRGAQVKRWPITLPYMRQQGVYVEGKSYVRGDVVTWGGSQWHCEAETSTKPGDGSKHWTLIVKRGRDGRDGRDGREPAPVVSVGVPPRA